MNRALDVGPVSLGVGFALRDWVFGVTLMFGVCGVHSASVHAGPVYLFAEFYTDN